MLDDGADAQRLALRIFDRAGIQCDPHIPQKT